MVKGVGFGGKNFDDLGRKGEKLKENEEKKERKENHRNCGLPIVDCGIKRLVRSPKSDDTRLDGPENNDEQNAELHDRKGPELDGAKGNGSEND